MPSNSPRRLSRRATRFGVLAAGIALAAMLTACESGIPEDTSVIGDNGSPIAITGTPTSGPTTHPTTHPPAAATYPNDYAQATLDAWAAGDSSRLTQLTSAADAHQLLNTIGAVNPHWTFIHDDGAAGSTFMSYYNAAGDEITIRLINSSIAAHKYHAASLEMFDPMSYPTDAQAYVTAFVDGWIFGNDKRMTLLSNSGVTDHFLTLYRPDSGVQITQVPGSGAAGHVEMQVKEPPASLDQRLIVATPVLGSPHAIENCDPSCS